MKPEKIGRYEIKSELGRGGMATVYKAYDPRFEREVAVKVLPREMLHDPQFRVRFEREAKTIASLEHPAIVPVYDVGEEDGQPYFVMRYMSDGSLADLIKVGPASIVKTAQIMERLAPALDEAHEKGIIHRDLKPGNILFDRTGEPYVSDFGIAKMTHGDAATVTGGAIIGTPAYMSPEQAQGEKVDGRSDIYALGVIAFEMLTGRQPYEADTPMAVVVKHITEPVPHILDTNPNLPADIERVIERAMAKNRNDRYPSAKEFSASLLAVSRGESPTFSGGVPAIGRQSADKTQLASPKMSATRISARPETKLGLPAWALPAVALVVILGVMAVGAFMIFGTPTAPVPTVTTVAATASAVPIVVDENTPIPSATEIPPTLEPATETPSPTPQPVSAGVGGADGLAFIANNEIWVMNLDGSDLRALTNDGVPKTDLQWLPDGNTLVFLSGKNINLVEADTGRFDTLVSFLTAPYLEAFRISPDGKQVAISLNREMYIVPFDLEAIRKVRGKTGLIAMNGCITHTAATQAGVQVKEFRWSTDGKSIAWLFAGVGSGDSRSVDLVRVVDISTCDETKLELINEFPGTFFTPHGYVANPYIPGYDWDGEFLFLMSTFIRNQGWGDLYVYDLDLRKAYEINPIEGRCCYRDPVWSPDKTHMFFAFQDIQDGFGAKTEFYYVPYSSIDTGIKYTPIPMPEDFFKNSKEAPQPALHSVLP